MRTIFTAPSCAGGVHEIRLGGLSEIDGLAVLRAGRPIGQADLAAARSIVSRLGGHPQALAASAGYLHDHEGLVSYLDYDAGLAQAGPDPDILAVIGRALGEVTPAVRTVIALGALLDATAVPTALIGAVLAGDAGIRCPEQAAGAAIRRLCHGGFARAESSALRSSEQRVFSWTAPILKRSRRSPSVAWSPRTASAPVISRRPQRSGTGSLNRS